MLKEYPLPELGYFTVKEAERIAEIMRGKSYMKWEIGYCNLAGNCTLVIKTEYDETPEEIKNFFLWGVLAELAKK